MKKTILSVGLVLILLSTAFLVSGYSIQDQSHRSVHRGIFQAELGLRDNTTPIIEVDGSYRDFRGRHLLTGSVSPFESDRSIRFQGMITRNLFLMQTGFRNHIINVVGKFVSYDEEADEYHGIWRGFAIGYGWTSGWITAELDG